MITLLLDLLLLLQFFVSEQVFTASCLLFWRLLIGATPTVSYSWWDPIMVNFLVSPNWRLIIIQLKLLCSVIRCGNLCDSRLLELVIERSSWRVGLYYNYSWCDVCLVVAWRRSLSVWSLDSLPELKCVLVVTYACLTVDIGQLRRGNGLIKGRDSGSIVDTLRCSQWLLNKIFQVYDSLMSCLRCLDISSFVWLRDPVIFAKQMLVLIFLEFLNDVDKLER